MHKKKSGGVVYLVTFGARGRTDRPLHATRHPAHVHAPHPPPLPHTRTRTTLLSYRVLRWLDNGRCRASTSVLNATPRTASPSLKAAPPLFSTFTCARTNAYRTIQSARVTARVAESNSHIGRIRDTGAFARSAGLEFLLQQ